MTEEELEAAAATGEQIDADSDSTENGTIIRDTDIVFDCPHCGHNLAIDYRGAGLQINCVQCGESVLVPIPDGMKIDDLDIEPGEILKQLFKTRRDLQKQEVRAEGLEEQLRGLIERNSQLYAQCESLAMQVAELRACCQQHTTLNEKMSSLLERMAMNLSNDSGSGEVDDVSGKGAEPAPEA